ncbi:uncharacterized protein [Triticum aestivum]|uniref:uncharacterized protein n=1 Tax=Triticum aestivum TaxID=4565 RepID=UPI001D017B32|nr:uncharacterized protein LOC123065017 [Triticum aestivum]
MRSLRSRPLLRWISSGGPSGSGSGATLLVMNRSAWRSARDGVALVKQRRRCGACGIARRRACYEGGRGGSLWNSGSANCGHGMAMKAADPGHASRDAAAAGSRWDAGAMAGTRICVARRPGSAHHLRRLMAAVTDSALNQRPAADIGAGDSGQRFVATRAANMARVPCGAAAARRVVAVRGRWPVRTGSKLGDSMCAVRRPAQREAHKHEVRIRLLLLHNCIL